MNIDKFQFLYDIKEQTTTRFVSFFGDTIRFDLAITTTDRFYGKKLVTDLQSGRTAIMGPDDLAEEGYLEHVYKLKPEEAEELNEFLSSIIDTINFTDL
jgi:hypothetical protein